MKETIWARLFESRLSANLGLNLSNPRLNFNRRLCSVVQSTVSANLGLNAGLNLTHLARWVKLLTSG